MRKSYLLASLLAITLMALSACNLTPTGEPSSRDMYIKSADSLSAASNTAIALLDAGALSPTQFREYATIHEDAYIMVEALKQAALDDTPIDTAYLFANLSDLGLVQELSDQVTANGGTLSPSDLFGEINRLIDQIDTILANPS